MESSSGNAIISLRVRTQSSLSVHRIKRLLLSAHLNFTVLSFLKDILLRNISHKLKLCSHRQSLYFSPSYVARISLDFSSIAVILTLPFFLFHDRTDTAPTDRSTSFPPYCRFLVRHCPDWIALPEAASHVPAEKAAIQFVYLGVDLL